MRVYNGSGTACAGACVIAGTSRLHITFEGAKFEEFADEITRIIRQSPAVCEAWETYRNLPGIYSAHQWTQAKFDFRHSFPGDYYLQLVDIAKLHGLWPEYIKLTVLTTKAAWSEYAHQRYRRGRISLTEWHTTTAPEFLVHDVNILRNEFVIDSRQDSERARRALAICPEWCSDPNAPSAWELALAAAEQPSTPTSTE